MLIKKMLTFTRNPLFFYRMRDVNVTMSMVIYIRELKTITKGLYKFQKDFLKNQMSEQNPIELLESAYITTKKIFNSIKFFTKF